MKQSTKRNSINVQPGGYWETVNYLKGRWRRRRQRDNHQPDTIINLLASINSEVVNHPINLLWQAGEQLRVVITRCNLHVCKLTITHQPTRVDETRSHVMVFPWVDLASASFSGLWLNQLSFSAIFPKRSDCSCRILWSYNQYVFVDAKHVCGQTLRWKMSRRWERLCAFAQQSVIVGAGAAAGVC